MTEDFEQWLGAELAEDYQRWMVEMEQRQAEHYRRLVGENPGDGSLLRGIDPAKRVLLRETLRRGRTHPLADPTPWTCRSGVWAQRGG